MREVPDEWRVGQDGDPGPIHVGKGLDDHPAWQGAGTHAWRKLRDVI